MITLDELDGEIDELRADFPSIEHYVRVVTEDQATARLHDKFGPCLVVTIPSYQQTGNPENPSDAHAIIMWVLEKPSSDATEQQERDQYARLQELAVGIKEYIREAQEDGCTLWWRLQISSISIEPEYNAFGGFNGWAIAFTY
jgi:hypothetical protein